MSLSAENKRKSTVAEGSFSGDNCWEQHEQSVCLFFTYKYILQEKNIQIFFPITNKEINCTLISPSPTSSLTQGQRANKKELQHWKQELRRSVPEQRGGYCTQMFITTEPKPQILWGDAHASSFPFKHTCSLCFKGNQFVLHHHDMPNSTERGIKSIFYYMLSSNTLQYKRSVKKKNRPFGALIQRKTDGGSFLWLFIALLPLHITRLPAQLHSLRLVYILRTYN